MEELANRKDRYILKSSFDSGLDWWLFLSKPQFKEKATSLKGRDIQWSIEKGGCHIVCKSNLLQFSLTVDNLSLSLRLKQLHLSIDTCMNSQMYN